MADPNPTSWWTIIGLLSPPAVLMFLYAQVKMTLNRVRDRLPQRQPKIIIERASVAGSRPHTVLDLVLVNQSGAPAFNLRCQLDGLPGWEEKRDRVEGPERVTLRKPPAVTDETPIRSKRTENACLTIRYDDQFGYSYALSCPVEQAFHHGVMLYDLNVWRDRVQETKPKPSRWRLWKLRHRV
jgi:hypothetical protein